MTADHADLVASADRHFRGTIVREETFETFRDKLYAMVKEDHGNESIQWRLECLYRVGCRAAATWRVPYNGWAERLVMEELPALEERLRAAGVL